MTIVTLLCGLFALWATNVVAALPIDGVAAVVGGEVITRSEIDRLLLRQPAAADAGAQDPKTRGRAILEQIIDRRLILQEATRRNLQPTDADIEAALDDIQKRNHLEDRQALQAAITQGGRLSWKDYLDDLRRQDALFRLTGGQIREVTVGPEEARAYYDTHRAQFMTADEIHLDQIRFRPLSTDATNPTGTSDPRQRAEAVRAAMQNGGDIDLLAGQYAAEVIDLGVVDPNDLAPRIAERVASLSEGETSEPLATDFGVDLFRVRSRRPPQPIPFETSAPTITELLLAEKRAAVQAAWLKSLRDATYIERR